MTDPTASAWEVTRLILASPSTSPSEIAEAHGFHPSEIAELLPFVLDGLQLDFAVAHSGALAGLPSTPPPPEPGESPDAYAERFLSEVSQNAGLGPALAPVPEPAVAPDTSDDPYDVFDAPDAVVMPLPVGLASVSDPPHAMGDTQFAADHRFGIGADGSVDHPVDSPAAAENAVALHHQPVGPPDPQVAPDPFDDPAHGDPAFDATAADGPQDPAGGHAPGHPDADSPDDGYWTHAG